MTTEQDQIEQLRAALESTRHKTPTGYNAWLDLTLGTNGEQSPKAPLPEDQDITERAVRHLVESRDHTIAELADARRTAEHWKAEHLAGNAEIERLQADNLAVARLILANDRAGAVKWATGLVLLFGVEHERVTVETACDHAQADANCPMAGTAQKTGGEQS